MNRQPEAKFCTERQLTLMESLCLKHQPLNQFTVAIWLKELSTKLIESNGHSKLIDLI